jgi:prophage regulatory protein
VLLIPVGFAPISEVCVWVALHRFVISSDASTGRALALRQPSSSLQALRKASPVRKLPIPFPSRGCEMQQTFPLTLLRLPGVMQLTGLARSTIYKLVASGEFPAPLKLTRRAVAWPAAEIEQWVATRGRTR